MQAGFESRFGTLEPSQATLTVARPQTLPMLATVAVARPQTLPLLASFRFKFEILGYSKAIAVCNL